MQPDRWKRVREVYEEALDLSEERRAEFLEHECAGDEVMREQIAGMLDVDSKDPRFLERPTEITGIAAEPQAKLPERVGTYRIVRLIAAGGMGVVYEAVQESPQRRVALKMLRGGPLAPSLAQRFRYEAEILARLRHPHVAEIYEAGVDTAESGLEVPYFAMEFVPGASDIVTHVRAAGYDLRARLAVFLEVCDAVHYGHQQGVIHRDLKPGNILVDERGHAKVIDFGVARVTDADLAVSRMVTQTGELIGTLTYMSPEQLGGDPAAVDTRSDVYALGLVLYELLCGRGPYDLAGKPMTEVARIIRDVPPKDPRRCAPGLPEDLRWIVLRALEKEREQRYPSASELAADIGRFLAHEPVQAGPPSTSYRVRKFVRRNRLAVAAAALVSLALVTGTILASVGLVRASSEAEIRKGETARATDEADKFRSINDVLTDMFVAVQNDREGRDVRVAELLDRAAQDIGSRLADRPEVEAALRLVLAESYQSLGLQPEAENQARLALALWAPLRDSVEADQVDALSVLAAALTAQDQLDAAHEIVDQGLAATAGLEGARETALEFANSACTLLRKRGEYAEAARRLRDLLDQAGAELGVDAPVTLGLKAGLVAALHAVRVDEEVEVLSRELLEARERVDGAESYVALGQKLSLASVLAARAKFEEAEELYAEALNPMIRLVGDEHPRVLLALNELGNLQIRRGNPGEAVTILEEVARIRERTAGPEHSETLTARANLANARREFGDERGEDATGEIYRARRRIWGPDHPETLEAMSNHGIDLVGRGKVKEAEPILLECLDRRRSVSGDDDLKTLHAAHAVAYLYYAQSKFAEAKPYFHEAWQGFKRELGPTDEQTVRTAANYVVVLGRLGEYEEALPVSAEVVAIQREQLDPGDPNLVVIETNLAQLHRRTGQPAQAESLFRGALERAEEHLPEGHPLVATSTLNVAECIQEQGRCGDALPLFERTLELSELNKAVPRIEYARTRESYAECLFTLGRHEHARRELMIAYEVLETLPTATKHRTAVARTLIEVLEAWGRPEEADAWRAKLPQQPDGG